MMPLTDIQILVAEDEAYSRTIVVNHLRGLGAGEILEAENGVEALRYLEQDQDHQIGLAILDINMPGLNGLEVLKAIRTSRIIDNRGMPVIMLTANNKTKVVKATFALDATCFIIKPVKKADLEARIQSIGGRDFQLKRVRDYQAVDVPRFGS